MILFALALLASSPAEVPAAVPAQVTVTAPVKVDDNDKVICHVDVETGTRLGSHKECHTRRDWAQMQSENNDMLERATTVSTAGGPH